MSDPLGNQSFKPLKASPKNFVKLMKVILQSMFGWHSHNSINQPLLLVELSQKDLLPFWKTGHFLFHTY